jgi:hypothetical protein
MWSTSTVGDAWENSLSKWLQGENHSKLKNPNTPINSLYAKWDEIHFLLLSLINIHVVVILFYKKKKKKLLLNEVKFQLKNIAKKRANELTKVKLNHFY